VKCVTRDPEADRDTVELIREIALKYDSWAQKRIWERHRVETTQRVFLNNLFFLPFFLFLIGISPGGSMPQEAMIILAMLLGMDARLFLLRFNYFGMLEGRYRKASEEFAHNVLKERPYELTKKERAILIRVGGILRARRTEKGWKELLTELEDAKKQPNLGTWRFIRAMHENLTVAGQAEFAK
jgi:hypothetical protein